MPTRHNARCRLCGAQVWFIFNTDTGRSMTFDDPDEPRGSDVLANYIHYPDPRTGALVARHRKSGEPLAPEEELIRPHRRTCAAITRNNHDS